MQPVVIRFGRLGDMVLLAPMLRALHLRYAVPCRLVGPGGWTSPIYAGHPDVARIDQISNRHRPPLMSIEHWRLAASLRAPSGPVYVAETEPRALDKIRQLLKLARVARERCVFITDMTQIDHEHWVDRLLRFADQTPASFAGMSPPIPAAHGVVAAPKLALQDADRDDRDTWLRQRGLSGRTLVLVQSANKRSMRRFGQRSAADDDKSWPVASWCNLLRTVHTRLPGVAIILCGSPAEGAMLDAMRVAAGIEDVHVAAHDLPIRRLMATQQIAHSMISVDTGPAHLAAAVGCPLVVLFGACSAQVWAPRSATGSAVIAIGGAPAFSRADEIEPAQMIAAWQDLTGPDPAANSTIRD